MAKKLDSNKIDITQLKALFGTEIVIANRKIDELRGSLTTLIRINAELTKTLEEKPKKAKSKVDKDAPSV